MGKDASQGGGVEAFPARRDEHGIDRAANQRRPRLVEVAREHVRGLLAERHEAFLAALTAHMQLLAVEVDVRQVEPDRFRGAQTGGVDKLYERLVPQSQRAVALERVERRLDLSRLRRVWQ